MGISRIDRHSDEMHRQRMRQSAKAPLRSLTRHAIGTMPQVDTRSRRANAIGASSGRFQDIFPSKCRSEPMARVTVEDCVDKVENRFELILVASHRVA